MKASLLTFSALSLFVSVAKADVQSLKCIQDMRPVDGNYIAVELAKNEAGKFDVTYEVITSGFGGDVGQSKVTIAKNLDKCTFAKADSRIVQCYKSGLEAGEKTNTGFTTKLVTEVGVQNTEGDTYTTKSINLGVYSPQLATGGKGFPHMDYPGRFTHDFNAVPSKSILTNHCEIQ